MSPDSLRIASGIAVLALGIGAGLVVSRPPGGTVSDPMSPPPAVAIAEPIGPIQPASDLHLPGVPDSVTRVLAWSGNAGFADAATTSEIPPTVVDALTAHGLPIAIPSADAP